MALITVSPSEAKHAASLPKYKGQEYLARKLQLGPINEEDDLKSAALVDYYYDVLQFSVNRGIPWKEVVSSLNFASDVLQLSKGQPLVTGIRMLQNIAIDYVSSAKLSLQSAKLLSQYFTNTFIAHYKLYQYILTETQEENRGEINLTVEVPPQLMKLAEADTLQVWEYARKMHNIDVDEASRKAKLDGWRQELEVKSGDIEENVKRQFLEGDLKSITLNEAEKIISEVASTKMSLLREEIATNIAELKNSADIAVARQAIPVPQGWDSSQSLAPKVSSKPKSATESRKSSGRSTPSKKKK